MRHWTPETRQDTTAVAHQQSVIFTTQKANDKRNISHVADTEADPEVGLEEERSLAWRCRSGLQFIVLRRRRRSVRGLRLLGGNSGKKAGRVRTARLHALPPARVPARRRLQGHGNGNGRGNGVKESARARSEQSKDSLLPPSLLLPSFFQHSKVLTRTTPTFDSLL